MGCEISKHEEETAISHCRIRCNLLHKSIQNRYALSEAHGEYAQSLRSLSTSLHAFIHHSVQSSRRAQLGVSSDRDLPSGRSTTIKVDSARSSTSRTEHADGSTNRSKHRSVPPSTSFEKPPVEMQNSNFAPYPYTAHMDYRMPMPPMSSFFNFSNNTNKNQRYSNSQQPPVQEPVIPPIPRPASPDNSPWDFLDPFGGYDRYYESYVPYSSSRRVREVEGIPELEELNDEEDGHVHIASSSASKRVSVDSKENTDNKFKTGKETASNISVSSSRSSFMREAQAKEKKKDEREEVAGEPARVYRNDSEIVIEIKNQFEKMIEATEQISALLEVGKRRYSLKNSIRKVARLMICGLLPSPQNSVNDEFSNSEQYRALDNSSLSITMQKLHMWESKLLEEVQSEEKLRNEYQRKCSELDDFDDRGAEREQIEKMQRRTRKLSTQINVTLQVLGSISKKINEIRDEELWPQICELVEGLLKMWEVAFESHQVQLNAISQIQALDSIFASSVNYSEIHFQTTKQLQLDLLTWLTSFSTWVNAQRNYVQSLNNWLKTGLNHQPEITEDGVAPFSPSRLGLPPIFTILNDWSETMEKGIFDNGVIEAIRSFTSSISHLHETQKFEQHQKLMENKELKALRVMEMEEKLLRKKLESYNKKLRSISHQNYSHSSTMEMQSRPNSLKSNLTRVFESLQIFALTNKKTYEELHMQSNED